MHHSRFSSLPSSPTRIPWDASLDHPGGLSSRAGSALPAGHRASHAPPSGLARAPPRGRLRPFEASWVHTLGLASPAGSAPSRTREGRWLHRRTPPSTALRPQGCPRGARTPWTLVLPSATSSPQVHAFRRSRVRPTTVACATIGAHVRGHGGSHPWIFAPMGPDRGARVPSGRRLRPASERPRGASKSTHVPSSEAIGVSTRGPLDPPPSCHRPRRTAPGPRLYALAGSLMALPISAPYGICVMRPERAGVSGAVVFR
jgi:hypothetical protein